jgi:pimeloyl-ACP methyl ester carboxylesterase
MAGCSQLRALRHLSRGCVDAAVPAGDTGIVTTGVVPTRAVAGPVGYEMFVPRGVYARSVTRVAYVLPGRDGRANGTLGELGFSWAAQHVVTDGSPPFAIIAVDAGSTYFHPRTSGEDRLYVIEHDLPRLARTLLSPTISREALIGQSMGGYGALLAAERAPRRYASVAVAGPALFTSYREETSSVGDAFDSAQQFAQYDVIAHAARLAHVPVLVRCGTADPFAPAVKAFARACPTADVGFVEHGCHDTGLFRVTAPDMVAFVARHW